MSNGELRRIPGEGVWQGVGQGGERGVVRIDSPPRYQEPEFLPWDGRRVPITFVGGYLGAGKTTVINELLAAADRPIAVVVNDVGSVNIDARLIRRADADMIELTDGCVCCSSIDGMGAALDALRARAVPPDHVVVELSGVADPQRMIPWGQSAGFSLDGLVIVVAADHLAGSALPDVLRETIRTHINAADLLILTKTDVVDAETAARAHTLLGELAPGTPVIESAQGRLLPGALGRLMGLGGRRPGGVTATPPATMFDMHEVSLVPAPTGLSLMGVHHWVQLILNNEGPNLMRAKGVIDTTDEGLVIVQVVGSRIDVERLPDPERQAPTDLVVIRLAASVAS